MGELWENVGLGKRKHHLFHRACSLVTVHSLKTFEEITQTYCPWNNFDNICKCVSNFWICDEGYIVTYMHSECYMSAEYGIYSFLGVSSLNSWKAAYSITEHFHFCSSY